MDLHRVVAFVRAALECSIYLAPTEPGLTHAELVEIGAAVSKCIERIDRGGTA